MLDQFLDPLVGLSIVISQFARMSPEQELRIVEALQGSGQIVILVDDNYSTILLAAGEGRQIFADIRKIVRSLLASNAGGMLVMFVGVLTAGALGLADATGAGSGSGGGVDGAAAGDPDPVADELSLRTPTTDRQSADRSVG